MSHYSAVAKARSRRVPSSSGLLSTPSYTGARAPAPPHAELSEDQRAEIQEAFELFDTDKDGAIDYHELKVAMRALGFDLKKPELLKILRENDASGSGLMEWKDFERILTERILSRDPREEIRRAFALFDDDGTGKISLRNLKRVAKELGENLDDEELQAMIDEFDLDQDGEIDASEFEQIMMDEP
ncbi:Calcium-binding component of the spindle pole body (SPB) half-bridge [Malassezia brasiliensis]|uniref:Calcium-binding component of the spindle pole body (SPB) half-bridge n=1 Tax=Malassezia brasiliensis TaxID=1821822 RepID=A0AAF0DRK3_9BASI|nr:Calcium-binding component of the spindle pole body (SPB) half-bridge [Malassezia brasiliensis]